MVIDKVTSEQIIKLLSEIPDPEIPVVNIVEMGMIRNVRIENDEVNIDITPTYSGCPATKMISEDIQNKLKENGVDNVKLKMVYAPAWSTNWIKDEVKEKLRRYGITPPDKITSKEDSYYSGLNKEKHCPFCNSTHTKKSSEFGSTPCKALYYCNDCSQPFEVFKCI